MKALIVGTNYELTSAAIPLLNRAEFEVDVLFYRHGYEDLKNRSLIHKLYESDTFEELPRLASLIHLNNNYDLVVLGDEESLKLVLFSALSEQEKLALLPVKTVQNYAHLSSKIGFSQVLDSANIATPEYKVASNKDELILVTKNFGYPFFIKIDSSGGGTGVFECESSKDILKVIDTLVFPVLVQRKIEGKTLDLAGFYQDGKLIYFSYSTFEKVIGNKFGPSVLREYAQLGCIDSLIFEELNQLGAALGANGFMNTTCIEATADGKRYYFEGDMRPNAWVDYGRYIGSNDASKIKDYFLSGKTLKNRPEIKYELPLKMVIPMISRLTFLELISNYQHAWRYPDGVQGVFYFLALLAKRKCKTSYSQIIGYFEKSSSLLLYRSQIIRDLKNIGLSLIHKGLYRFELFIGVHIKPMISPKIMPKLRSIYRYLRLQD